MRESVGEPNSAQPSTATTNQTPPYPINPYDQDSDPFDSEHDPNSLSGKRLADRDDIHSGTSKRTRLPSAGGSGDYRKDRGEWSDTAIACLLVAYSEKFVQLNRGNLRGRDWEEVAIVSDRCENQSKSVEQCKNKMDNLKKRYKLERHRCGGRKIPKCWQTFIEECENKFRNWFRCIAVEWHQNLINGVRKNCSYCDFRASQAFSSASCPCEGMMDCRISLMYQSA